MLVILVPTMIWVRLRAPWARGLVEFLCLLPLTIPALVIVVGLRNVYLWVTYFLGESALTLTFVYVVLVLPFAYRALDGALSSIDLQTLSEAARSLGAGWTHHHPAGGGAQHLVGHPVGRVHLDRRGARRVHHRLTARLRDAAGEDRARSARPTARRRWLRRWRCCCSASYCFCSLSLLTRRDRRGLADVANPGAAA